MNVIMCNAFDCTIGRAEDINMYLGMGHLSILMSGQVLYNHHTFMVLEFLNFTILENKVLFFFFFWQTEGKNYRRHNRIQTNNVQIY